MIDVNKLHKISNIKILIFGDYMVDKYIDGIVSRISPEAPVPILEVKDKDIRIGGCGNVINNIITLGAKVRLLGGIGNDSDGEYIEALFKQNSNIDMSFFKKFEEIKTISKTRIVSKKQQFIRIDDEIKKELPQKYYKFLSDNIDIIFNDISTLVISDYNKGAVNEEISQLLIKEANARNIPIIVDPKGMNYSKYYGATICTPNVKELSEIINKEIKTEDDINKYGKELCKKNNIKYLLLTRSEKGISLINKETDLKKDFPTIAKDVIDVSGAGDTVVATTAVLISLNFKIDEICKLANIAASVVVSKFGTSTVNLNELICQIFKTSEFKLISLDTAKYIVNNLKEQKKKIVFTNGCYDMLHIGHISSFKQAKEFGDILIVAVNSDLSVKENKGDLRPIINENDRINLICELDCVDYVLLMDDKNPCNIIKEIKPDISVKGEDWENKYVPEKAILESYGGKIEFIKCEKDKSTTNIINKILKIYNGK